MVANGRNAGGRFAAGNAGGPGRPKRVVEQAYLAKLSSVVSMKSWKAVCERALADAIAGDARARGWLAKYLMSEPVQKLELETKPAPGRFLTREQMFAEVQTFLAKARGQGLLPSRPAEQSESN